ncbi:MAG TPA: class I SAM-dependent methyltransferase [Erysipelothrix sp.]|nr:class I SAM-dependent methyltransferase [Erysipelothrix sp.]
MSAYYDLLFSDLEGTALYFDFVKKHIDGTRIIEMACGTGDLLSLLSKEYDVVGVDLDVKMLDVALKKYPELEGKLFQGDFLNFQTEQRFDTLICTGDSLNYINNMNELESFVRNVVKLSDTVIVDMHHPFRLIEFREGYYEEGRTDSFDYSYLIDVSDDFLVHQINLLDGTFDTVVQWVFDPLKLKSLFENEGYQVHVFTDFDLEGYHQTGEKIMMIAKKVT